MADTPPGSRRSSHRRRGRVSLRQVLSPRDGTEVAAVTGILIFVLALATAGVLIAVGGKGSGGPGTHPQATGTGGPVRSSYSGPLDAKGVWDPYVVVPQGGAAGSPENQALWVPTVQRFAGDFLGASRDPHWLAKVKPLVSPQLLERLRRIDRADVPHGTVGSVEVGASGDNAADATVTYTVNGIQLRLKVGVVDLPGDGRSWMVFSYANGS